jgi:hypothetical protein
MKPLPFVGAIAGEETIVAHPAGRHKSLAQQRQHHVTAAENKRARAVAGFEESYSLRYAEATQDGKAGEQEKEGRQCREPNCARDRHGNSRSIFARPYRYVLPIVPKEL